MTHLVRNLNLDNNLIILTTACVLAAATGSAICWGWGFDARPSRMYTLWCLHALVSMILYILTLYGYQSRLALWAVLFLTTTGSSYFVLISAHLREMYSDQIMTTMAAWVGVLCI